MSDLYAGVKNTINSTTYNQRIHTIYIFVTKGYVSIMLVEKQVLQKG